MLPLPCYLPATLYLTTLTQSPPFTIYLLYLRHFRKLRNSLHLYNMPHYTTHCSFLYIYLSIFNDAPHAIFTLSFLSVFPFLHLTRHPQLLSPYPPYLYTSPLCSTHTSYPSIYLDPLPSPFDASFTSCSHGCTSHSCCTLVSADQITPRYLRDPFSEGGEDLLM